MRYILLACGLFFSMTIKAQSSLNYNAVSFSNGSLATDANGNAINTSGASDIINPGEYFRFDLLNTLKTFNMNIIAACS